MQKNKSFIKSVANAVRGVKKAIFSERNYLIYLILIILSTPVNLWVKPSLTQIIALFICICGAYSAECLNTAIEKLADVVEKNYSEAIKYVKDIAAGGVLFWGIAYYGVELFLIGGKLFG